MKRPRRVIGFCLGLAALATMAPSAGDAAPPLVARRCIGTAIFHGHSEEAFPGVFLWYWSLDGSGTCTSGVLQKHPMTFSGYPLFGTCCFPGPVTTSPSQPWSSYLVTTTLTNPGGGTSTYHQAWYTGTLLTIHAWYPVPSTTIIVGGLTGLGLMKIGAPKGSASSVTLTGPVIFTFGTQEIPLPEPPPV